MLKGFLIIFTSLLFMNTVNADGSNPNFTDGFKAAMKGNNKLASKFYESGCNEGDGFSCAELGKMYLNGSGVAKDKNKGEKLLKISCDIRPESRSGMGCFALAHSYKASEFNHIKAKASKYFKRGCEIESVASCYELGYMYYNGESVMQNKSVAKKYFGLACEEHNFQNSCENYKKLNEAGY